MTEAEQSNESNGNHTPFMMLFKEFTPEDTTNGYYSKSTGCAGREDEDDD